MAMGSYFLFNLTLLDMKLMVQFILTLLNLIHPQNIPMQNYVLNQLIDKNFLTMEKVHLSVVLFMGNVLMLILLYGNDPRQESQHGHHLGG